MIDDANILDARRASLEGPYIVRTLLDDVALSDDGQHRDISITCVEFWDGNLYIGTSAGEVLHYVQVPTADAFEQSPLILATRLQPGHETAASPRGSKGIQQILLLPQASKACILCNDTLYFYSLPELSPTLQTSRLVKGCVWIGGIDQDVRDDQDNTAVILVCLKTKISVVRIGTSLLKRIRDIELANCLAAARRGNIACAANSTSYSLLDIVEKARIPLFDIASAPEAGIEDDFPRTENKLVQDPTSAPAEGQTLPENPTAVNKTVRDSQSQPLRAADASSEALARPRSPGQIDVDSSSSNRMQKSMLEPTDTIKLPEERESTKNLHDTATTEPTTEPLTSTRSNSLQTAKKQLKPLLPHILSPTRDEFLLTTGTSSAEPGVGLFVNLDGDVVSRPTLEFQRYPEAIIVDGGSNASTEPQAINPPEPGYVLAVMEREVTGISQKGIEIQRWNHDLSGNDSDKHWLPITDSIHEEAQETDIVVGIHRSISAADVSLPEVAQRLGSSWKMLNITGQKNTSTVVQTAESKRDDLDLVNRFSVTSSDLLLWSGKKIMRIIKNPLVLRLDARLERVMTSGRETFIGSTNSSIAGIFNELRDYQPRNELEFFTFNYIRQRTSLALFLNLTKKPLVEKDRTFINEALISSELDPRVILETIPLLRAEIVQGENGVWLANGIQNLLQTVEEESTGSSTRSATPEMNVLALTKQYLQAWQRKKGFGSVPDSANVFATVDAALLHVLLATDSNSSRGMGSKGSVRAELHSVVDRGLVCFDRAVELLERYKRLYVLSRFYQSRKMAGRVLGTWRRLIEGEDDAGGEFDDGELQIRKYLMILKDRELVEEYGSWLAARNPQLGVRIFADDSSKIRFEAKDAVRILKDKAPAAVKDYLEYLVFGKQMAQYANDLIRYYLDSVLAELEESAASREMLRNTYKTYRALKAPKPTYNQFAIDSAIDTYWWRNRLRLLQLLGGSHGATSQYDTIQVLSRVSKFEFELVPEMIILDGRRGRHKEAIHLLAHGLGDFDTATSYCALGGLNLYGPQSEHHERPISAGEEQVTLFGYLLDELLKIEDDENRMTQTCELLLRYANCFDVLHVLASVPDTWAVELISGFLERAFRIVVSERHETSVTKALLGLHNLNTSIGLIAKTESYRAVITGSTAEAE